MKISHLVVNGCSWTYGMGLEDPITQSWPAQLGKSLNLPVVNLAVPGSGNEGIYRRTAEYVALDNSSQKKVKPLVVIVWSQYWRTEFWRTGRDIGSVVNTPGFSAVPLNSIDPKKLNLKNLTASQKLIVENWDENYHFQRTLMQKFSLYNLLRSSCIPYINIDYTGELFEYLGGNNSNIVLKPWYKEMLNTVTKDNNFLNYGLHGIGQPFSTTPDDGPNGPEGSLAIANKLLEEINARYKIENDCSIPFKTLKDFKTVEFPLGLTMLNEWELHDKKSGL